MKIYIFQTYRIEEKHNGIQNHTLIKEGVLDHSEDVIVSEVLPPAANDTSDRHLSEMSDFFKERYPNYTFRYQEQDVDLRLSTNKAIKNIFPYMDDDIRSIGTGTLLAPATYAAIVIGSTIKEMRGRAEAIAAVCEYFNITTTDLRIAKEGYLDKTEKFSWEN